MFAVIALVVGMFVIYNSFSIIVAQRTARWRCCGRSGRAARCTGGVLIEALVIGATGSLSGFLAGLALASFLSSFLDPPPGSLAILPRRSLPPSSRASW